MKQSFGKLLGALILEKREAGGFTQRELAEESFPNLKDHEGKERRIRELESGSVDSPQAQNYTPLCETLDIDRTTIRALKSKAVNAKQQDETEFQEIIAEKGSAQAAIDAASALSRDQLELLASRFEFETPHKASDTDLRTFLTLKAEEYRTYRDQIGALDARIPAIHNLKAAAQDAANNLDFDEVESLLSRVDEVETEIAAETKVIRAHNALLLNRADQAFTILSAAADSFASIAPHLPAEKRDEYWNILYNHGLRYGGTGLSCAIQMSRDALTTTAKCSPFWTGLQNNLALALDNQGTRTDGLDGTALLAEAVTAYRDALTVYTKADHPMQWATITQNLAIALGNQGTRTDGPNGTALLAEAVAAYRDALTIRTKAGHPEKWATTTQNLAGALATQGTRTDGPDGISQLADAVQVFRDTLTIRTRADHPVQWAEIQENLAIAELAIANHPATADPTPHLTTALAHVDAALIVFDPIHMPYYFNQATRLRDLILARLA